MRVYSEVGVTVAVSEDPPQFVRYTFGHERIARSDSTEEIERTERLVHEVNERMVEKRVRELVRLVKRVHNEK